MHEISGLHECAIQPFAHFLPYFLVVSELCEQFLLFFEFVLDVLLIFVDLVDFLGEGGVT
jgi:hypothetical protein